MKHLMSRCCRWPAVALFTIALIPLCVVQQQDQPNPETHRIMPGEALQIVIQGEPELSRTQLVGQDGKIKLPLVNHIHAAGLTHRDLQLLLEEKLKPFLLTPRATVAAAAGDERVRIRTEPDGHRPGPLPELWPIR